METWVQVWKTGVENDIFWSEIELGFGEPAITGRYTPTKNSQEYPPGISQSWLIIVIYILISFSFLFWVVRHFRLSLLNNFYCEIFLLYNIVIRIINSVASVNLKTAGMAGQNIVINKTLTERTLRRRCTKLMWLFFVSGTCECRNVVNQGLVEMGEKGDVEP